MMPPEIQQENAGVLRVAIVLDSYNNVSAWMATVIDDLRSADFVDLRVVVAPAENMGADEGRADRLFRKYAGWDAGRKRSADDPLRVVDVSSHVAGLASTSLNEYIEAPQLAGLGLDVLIWLGAGEPEQSLKKVARFGLWIYRRRKPDFFWEIYEGDPVTRLALEVLQEGAAQPFVAYEAFSATEQGWSWQQNREAAYWRASAFPLRCLRQLHSHPAEGLRGIQNRSSSLERAEPRSLAPTDLQMAGFALRNAGRTVSRRLLYSRKESYWFIAYRTDTSKFVSNTEELDLRGFTAIEAPDGHFYADPFVIEWRGQNYLFVEDYLFDEQRGCISVMAIGPQGVTSEAERVLDLPYHLSYPFVFEQGGELYMIPETLGAGQIELYRAAHAPERWEFVKALREDVQAVDTTVWIEDGRFYFFTNIAERGATVNDDLYLFWADDLLGMWRAHPGNPIVTDVRRSRGAGKLFRRNGKLIRPAQDCSVRYGYACQLNEIEVLTPTEYRERPVRRIEPDWAPGLIGTHTINSNGALEVIDGQIYKRKYRARGQR